MSAEQVRLPYNNSRLLLQQIKSNMLCRFGYEPAAAVTDQSRSGRCVRHCPPGKDIDKATRARWRRSLWNVQCACVGILSWWRWASDFWDKGHGRRSRGMHKMRLICRLYMHRARRVSRCYQYPDLRFRRWASMHNVVECCALIVICRYKSEGEWSSATHHRLKPVANDWPYLVVV